MVGESNVGVDPPNPPEPKVKAERPKEVGAELRPSSPKSEIKYIFWKRGTLGINSHLE